MSRILEGLGVRLIWFDSLGAKSSSIAIETSEGVLVIDPGVAAMQPSYPLSVEEKIRLREQALKLIETWCRRASAIIVTHYHYDHHVPPHDPSLENARAMWLNSKLLILKNPNTYINSSQWERARILLSELFELTGVKMDDYLSEPEASDFEDPVSNLSIAISRSFGSYDKRRRELLEKGRRWFMNLIDKLWSKGPWIKEAVLPDGTKIVWGDGKVFNIGDAEVLVLEPWFHGVEYDRTGWVTPLLIKHRNWRIFYSSDLMGPIIEDYAEYIAKLRPDVVILDGPPTYLFPFMFNRINLRRAIENALTIISAEPKLIIYDHHLLREKKWRKRVSEVFDEAKRRDVLILTAAEYLGRKPLIDSIA
ncbi:MAG: MBL fold metallo-hydrolase [Thermoprotei archaeon]|nr:MAG: MBL fold metallo-hydrolase [Thermoprotei archaeon]RLF23084.1 MAG: MBL fold metallo-hydrolase [Thermoprotei archaeon]